MDELFLKTKSTLKILEERDEIYLEDVLGLFLDICSDAAEKTGVPAALLPRKDEKAAAMKLSQVGKLYDYLLNSSLPSIEDEKRKQMLQTLKAQVGEKETIMQKAQEEERNAREELLRSEQEAGHLKAEAIKAREETQRLEEQIRDLEAFLAEYESGKEALKEQESYGKELLRAWNQGISDPYVREMKRVPETAASLRALAEEFESKREALCEAVEDLSRMYQVYLEEQKG